MWYMQCENTRRTHMGETQLVDLLGEGIVEAEVHKEADGYLPLYTCGLFESPQEFIRLTHIAQREDQWTV